ncbi:MAG: LysR family transcriptional regulator [Clostridiales bacterium]|nr:LysR family transcriptional regulator [Candidatus Crickella merdequi]
MDSDKLRVFLKVAETGSFSRAAEVLGYTQAGVSYVIKSLEEELELQLVERNYNGIRLSEDGIALYPEVCRAVHAADSFRFAIAGRKNNTSLTLHIGAIDTIATRWFADAMHYMMDNYTGFHFDIVKGNPFEINRWLEEGVIDLGFTEHAWASRDFYWGELTKDPYYGVLYSKENITAPCPFEAFHNREFFVADYGEDRNSITYLRSRNVTPVYYPDKISNTLIVKSIALGMGSTIMPASMLIDSGMTRIGSKFFPKVVRMEDNVMRELGYIVLESNRQNPMIKQFVAGVAAAIEKDVMWNEFVEMDVWTYNDLIEANKRNILSKESQK